MRVLMISTDSRIFEAGSAVRARMVEYGTLCEELRIVVFTRRGKIPLLPTKISNTVFAYPTNSRWRLFSIVKALQLGRKLLNSPHLKNDSPFVISAQDPFETGFVALRLARRFGARLQIQIHTDVFSTGFRSTIINRLRSYFARYILPKAHAIRVVSTAIQTSLVKRGIVPERITVLPIFVDVERFAQAAGVRPKTNPYGFAKVVLMISRLAPEKDIGLALSVFKQSVTNAPDTCLVVVGSGVVERELREIAVRLRIQEKVFFEPWQHDVVSLYALADVFLSTSRFEGYGMTFIEAAASGIPIVSTDVGIVREYFFEKGAFVCSVGDTECLVRELSLLITDSNLCKKMGEAVQRVVRTRVGTKEAYLALYKASLEASITNP